MRAAARLATMHAGVGVGLASKAGVAAAVGAVQRAAADTRRVVRAAAAATTATAGVAAAAAQVVLEVAVALEATAWRAVRTKVLEQTVAVLGTAR
jgi:hypothetical protein